MPVNNRAGEWADPWKNYIPFLFKVAHSFILLLILCQILKAEGKFQLCSSHWELALREALPETQKIEKTSPALSLGGWMKNSWILLLLISYCLGY